MSIYVLIFIVLIEVYAVSLIMILFNGKFVLELKWDNKILN